MNGARENSAAAIRRILDGAPGHVHMVGVCGVGMAGVAFHLRRRGFRVTGCDAHRNRLADWLEKEGVETLEGHGPEHLGGQDPSPRPSPARGEGRPLEAVDWVVRTPAVAEESAEIVAARQRGTPIFFRGEVLPELLSGRTSVAVCGTHGKTTTSTFIARLLRSAGFKPAWCIGGENASLGGVAGQDGDGPMVVEADESDGTLALYRADVGVVTNIDFDHMEHFASVEAFEECFRTFVRQTRRRVVYCLEDPRARALCAGIKNGLSYALDMEADLRGCGLILTHESIGFDLVVHGEHCGRIELPVPGRHNALNALAAIGVGQELGVGFDGIRDALAGMSLPKRRFEKVVDDPSRMVISDYAHHPSEVRALVRTARALPHARLLAVFQPHRYTRTLALGADFPPAFEGMDTLVLMPVYEASERELAGGHTWDLYRRFREAEGKIVPKHVFLASSLAQAWGFLREERREGDLMLVIGAGDVEQIAGWARDEARRPSGAEKQSGDGTSGPVPGPVPVWRRREPLAGKTTLGVGGAADFWAEPADVSELRTLLGWSDAQGLPCRVLGAGSNTLVSDLGVRGVVFRLNGEAFAGISETERGIRIGAAAPLKKLLDWLQDHGRGGYEFLEGIPGTVGGAVSMNAGAWGESIGSRVIRVEGCAGRGDDWCAEGKVLTFGYRVGPCGPGQVITAVWLSPGEPARPDAIAERRTEVSAKRSWCRGLRTAGSVFKNPAGGAAGRLIESVGLKGVRVGGAEFSERHANVIATGPGALASDVLTLIELARFEVRTRCGVELEREVQVLE